MRISERWAPTRHTLQHKASSSCSRGWRHSQHELPANMKQARRRRRRRKFTLDLPLHKKAEDRAGKCWPRVLRCRVLSFLLREKRTTKALSGLCPPTLPCTSYAFASVSQLLYHTGGLIFTSTQLFPIFL